MKKFLVMGTIIDASKMNPQLMEAHKKYTQAWMDEGKIVMSALLSDYSGAVSMVFADSMEEVETFYANEPFAKAGMQRYELNEIDIHYLSPDLK